MYLKDTLLFSCILIAHINKLYHEEAKERIFKSQACWKEATKSDTIAEVNKREFSTEINGMKWQDAERNLNMLNYKRSEGKVMGARSKVKEKEKNKELGDSKMLQKAAKNCKSSCLPTRMWCKVMAMQQRLGCHQNTSCLTNFKWISKAVHVEVS